MEALGAAGVEIVKCASIFFYSRISALANLHHNLKTLQIELEKLNCRKNEIEEDIRLYQTEGKYPTAQANGWIKSVEELDRQVQPILEEGVNVSVNGCNLAMHYKFQLSRKAIKMCKEVKRLLTDSPHFQNLVAHRKPPVKAVEKEDVPSLAGQKAAEEMLSKIMVQLGNGGIKRIAVYGMGGVGKTTLVKNLNNLLESSCLMVSFDIVISVAVSRDLDLGRIQSRIAERLSLEFDVEESTEGRAAKLHQTLAGKKFLVILDDVWDKLDLDKVGIPQGNNQADSKILLTTRNLDVCRAMMTDVDIKMDVLDEEAAWNLFAECAGNVAKLDGVETLARAIARECCGLPLAIKTVGTSMRHKVMIELWQNALCQLKCSTPHVRSIEKEVYVPLKLSFSSLPSKIHQLCFLYCALYPGNFSIKTSELIQCWIADGLIDENQTLEKAYNFGIALVENLKDWCMLEQGEGSGTVRMHNVLRDVAIWISKEKGFFCQAGLTLTQIPHGLQKSYTKISFMNNKIARLPTQLLRCPDLTVLLLQGNPLEKIPDNFFREVTALRVLDLSGSLIKSLPPSLLYLIELQTLLLRDCSYLEKLPPLGDLIELRVLDLCGTRLRDLPWEMGMLSNLRELNLSHTHFLQNIEAGTISGLANLEALDMSFSAYKWDARNNEGDRNASFDELLTLEKLSVLQIRVDSVECLALDDDWLKRLRKFTIRISPSCDSNYPPISPDEKRVILRGVDLITRGLEGLFFNANALDLVACGGISNLSEIVSRDLCGLPSLKSLTLSGCDCITSLINGENILRSMFPNLEHLKLSRLRNLAKIVEGMVPKRGCLRKLKTIQVVNCRKLKVLISFSLLRQLRKLEEIRVGNCRRIKCLVVAGTAPEAVLPKLRVLQMWNMMSLKTVCSRTVQWPALERIEESNCAVLLKLPISGHNVANVKEIKGDIDWWNNITWDDEEIKSILQPRFQAHTILTALKIQDRDEDIKQEAAIKDKVYAHIHLEH